MENLQWDVDERKGIREPCNGVEMDSPDSQGEMQSVQQPCFFYQPAAMVKDFSILPESPNLKTERDQ